jgi:hypothetical protein
MLELPLRDAGFVLPSWEELSAVVEAARERDAVVHFDGARLWESTTHFGRPLDEIADLADSVYVSFYKSLDGLGGAALAARRPSSTRRRPGGTATEADLPAVPHRAVGADRPGPGTAPAARVRGPRARGRRGAARGVRGGRGALGASTPSSRTPTSSRSGCRTTRRRHGGGDPAGRGDEDRPLPNPWDAKGPAWRSPRSTVRAAGPGVDRRGREGGGRGLRGAAAALTRPRTGAGERSVSGCQQCPSSRASAARIRPRPDPGPDGRSGPRGTAGGRAVRA